MVGGGTAPKPPLLLRRCDPPVRGSGGAEFSGRSFPRRSHRRSGGGTARAGNASYPDTGHLIQHGDDGESYEILGLIGQGGVGRTYAARTSGGRDVAVKVLSFSSMKSWKQLELFEREAQVLSNLRHPMIPEYVDYFEIDDDASGFDKQYYLVQQLAPGTSLARRIADGWRPTEPQIVEIALSLLDVLEYLGGLRPPVIHRDLKPENIIVDDGAGDRKLFLVDFGGVQAAAAQINRNNSTIIGTYGYMAPEQFGGAAVEASDLYGLGATLLFLLSASSPSEFPQSRLKIDFKGLTMSRKLSEVLDGLLEPAPEDRPSIAEVRAILRSRSVESFKRGNTKFRNGRVRVERTLSHFSVTIMPASMSGGGLMNLASTSSFAIAWNLFIFVWTRGALIGAGPLFAAFSLPFWVAGASLGTQALQTFYNAMCTQCLEVKQSDYVFWKELPRIGRKGRKGRRSRKGHTGKRENLRLLGIEELSSGESDKIKVSAISFMTEEGKLYVGEGLPVNDLQELYLEIEGFLKKKL